LIKNSVVDVLGDFWLGQLGRIGRVGDCPVDTGMVWMLAARLPPESDLAPASGKN
jgi:hypothetical protein